VIESIILKIKRRESPFSEFLHSVARGVTTASLPLPRFINPVLGMLYALHQGMFAALRWTVKFFYIEPLFRGRCESIGKRFNVTKMPFVVGHTKIYIGDDVNFFGKVDIFSGRIFDEPKLILQNRVDIGHNVSFVVNKQILIEDDVNVASRVSFMDTDGHPRDVAERIADLPPRPEEIRPVRVCKNAWIGHGSSIMKGVTIGEGAIIGADSVVVTDIPPYCVAMGNPARVIKKNIQTDTGSDPRPSG
jgi:acetyltransferase-like isoleucine patch superfamily enzyme